MDLPRGRSWEKNCLSQVPESDSSTKVTMGTNGY